MNNWTAAKMVDIFERAIDDYHIEDSVDIKPANPYDETTFYHTLYKKCLIDTIQWHLEDIIRDPEIDDAYGMEIKRRIDRYNQERTDTVEQLDYQLLSRISPETFSAEARINTESLGWAIDRLSILCLKVYHMEIEAHRPDADNDHKASCLKKLNMLKGQQADLCLAINQLIEDIQNGVRIARVYRQMKMYNDEKLNPILYEKKV